MGEIAGIPYYYDGANNRYVSQADAQALHNQQVVAQRRQAELENAMRLARAKTEAHTAEVERQREAHRVTEACELEATVKAEERKAYLAAGGRASDFEAHWTQRRHELTLERQANYTESLRRRSPAYKAF